MPRDPGAPSDPFRELFELSPDAVLVFVAGNVAQANPAAVRLLRAGRVEDLIGRASRELVAPAHLPGVIARVAALMSGEARSTRAEEQYVRLDGTCVDVESHATRATFHEGKAFLVLLRDITARKAAEAREQRQRSQEMGGLAKLAGGVAHGFNNLLTVILESADHLAGLAADPDGDLERIREAAGRAAALTTQLLAVAQKAPLHPRVAEVDRLVASCAETLAPLLGPCVRLSIELHAAGALANVDADQLELVLGNAARNARDAMPDGGCLTIATRPCIASLGGDAPPCPGVVIEVRDTGVGMDEATRRRAFEPFFSTKPASAGSGLGLSTAYGIVAQLGGRLELESAPGEGTCLRVLVPQCAPAAPLAHEPAPVSRRPGIPTVLLLEDEASVRRATSRILRSLGYAVVEAALPSEALAVARDRPGPIDALVTDVVMPEMNGPEAARAFLALRPGVPVVYVSGYSAEALEGSHVAMGIRPLTKPFTRDQLAAALRAAMEPAVSGVVAKPG